MQIISSGSTALNSALGIGGYPRGRIVELFGPKSSGKTTLCLHAIAECQAAGGKAAFIDAAADFDPSYAKGVGVRPEKLFLSVPDSGERALEVAESLARSGDVALIVIDSVAALTPEGDSHTGAHARLMSQALRKLTAIAYKSGATLLFVNELRPKLGVAFGSPETTPGSNALKFYASVRLDVRRIGDVAEGHGARTRVKVIKNKCGPPFRTAVFDIRDGAGLVDCAPEEIAP